MLESPDAPVERVLIIGAGPAGMAIAACLKLRHVPARLVDRQEGVGGAYQHIYGNMTLASPTKYAELPGLPLRTRGEYITAGEYRAYLQRYAEHHKLVVERAEVEMIAREGERFAVSFAGQAERLSYDVVVVATGMFDFPKWAEIEGLPRIRFGADDALGSDSPLVLHSSDWKGPEQFRGRRILIVGGATSAVEIAEECARAGLRPTVSARGKGVRLSPQRILGRDIHDFAHLFMGWLPRWLAGSYCDRQPTLPGSNRGFQGFRQAGAIEVRGAVRRFVGKHAEFVDGKTGEFDFVVLATGLRFETPYLPPEVSRTSAGYPQAAGGESRSWPGLYFIGFPCSRSLASEFLRGISRDAPVVADRIQQRLAKV
jgi:putative flavoprotein involved in K+ transport